MSNAVNSTANYSIFPEDQLGATYHVKEIILDDEFNTTVDTNTEVLYNLEESLIPNLDETSAGFQYEIISDENHAGINETVDTDEVAEGSTLKESSASSSKTTPRILKPIKTTRRFPCPHCDMILTSRPNRQKHIRIHTGEKPFVCSECGVAKVTKSDLTRHMMTHTRVREHFCGGCGKGFYSFNTIRRHVVRIHKKSPDDVVLYRISKYLNEQTNCEMVKIKVVKNNVNYNKLFRVIDDSGIENQELEAAVHSVVTDTATITYAC